MEILPEQVASSKMQVKHKPAELAEAGVIQQGQLLPTDTVWNISEEGAPWEQVEEWSPRIIIRMLWKCC